LIDAICDASFKPYHWEYGFFDPECYYTFLSENHFLVGFYIPGEDSNKDPIILVHGGPQGNGDGMVDMGVELSKTTGRSVLAYTQRGCRGSGLEFDLTKDGFQQSAQDLDKVIDATVALSGKKKVALLGHSLGTTLVNEYLGTMDKGKVSSYIAAGPAETDLASYARMFVKRKASELKNLALINTLRLERDLRLEKMKTEEALDEAELQKKLDESAEQQLIKNFTLTGFSNFDNAKDYYKRTDQSEELLLLRDKTYRYARKSNHPETETLLPLDLYKRLKDPKGHKMLKNIKVPTLIIAGEHDSLDPKSARITADRIPHSQLHVMKDAAHWMYDEKPEEFYPLVQSFLDRVDAGENIGTGKTVHAGKKDKKNGARKIKNLESVGKKTRIQDQNTPAA
jgi:pimeloyl-ACP methyl ester carboxylesterase